MFNQILSQQFWLMESNYLKRFLENVQTKNHSDVIEIEARSGEFNKRTSPIKPYTIDNGIASIKIQGPLMKRVPWVLSFLFGINSMEQIGAAFNAALSDKDIDAIFLHVDSPGSEVDGVQTLSNTIFDGRTKKPILSFVDGSGTSGAFWIASAAKQVVLADSTSRVGSVGVIGTHMELSEAAKKAGVGVHVFSAGRFKKIGNQFEKLSKDDIKYINSQFEYLHNIFIKGVEKNLARPLSKDAKEAMVFIGKQAVDEGLAHGIMNRKQALQKLKSMIPFKSSTSYKSKTSAQTKEISMKYTNFELMDFIKTVSAISDLDELRKVESDFHSEIKHREAKCENWIQQRDVKNLKDNITSLVKQQRLLIRSAPAAEKARNEVNLGESIGRSVLGQSRTR